MKPVLSIMINKDGISIDEYVGAICNRSYGYRLWDDEEMAVWLKKYLVDDVLKYRDVTFQVEGIDL